MPQMNPTPQLLNVPPRVEISPKIEISDKTISFLIPKYDCCVDKVVKEYVPYFQVEGYQVTGTLQKGAKGIIDLAPRWVVLLRVGTEPAFPIELGLTNISNIIQHLQRLGVRVTYYIDDFLLNVNNGAPVQIAALCDGVIVATKELAEFFLTKIPGFSKPVFLVPTHLDIPTFDSTPKYPFISQMNRYKIFMTSGGRIGTTGLFEICEKANNMPEEFDDVQLIVNTSGVAQLRTIINSFRHLHKTYIDWIPIETYYGICKSVNLIINPASAIDLDYLVPQPFQQAWLDAKSCVKYTMAGGARIPIIASPVMREYREAIKDGETGFLANSADEFIEKILYLKKNPAVAARVGIMARQDVVQNYDVRVRYPIYRDAIIGAAQPNIPVLSPNVVMPTASGKRVFIPSLGEGGPGSFYANMRKYLPIISGGKWSVTNQIAGATKAIAIAFLNAKDILAAIETNSLKYIYRVDGLPTNLYTGELDPINLKIMQELFRHTDHIVWQSKHCWKIWDERKLIPVEGNPHNHIIHNGVDTAVFTKRQSEPNTEYGLTALIVNWSTFPHKRFDLIFDILTQAQTRAPELRFSLLGNFKDAHLEHNQELLKQYPNVDYLGQIPDRNRGSLEKLAEIYRKAHFLVFTSEMEGIPNTVLEATASGVPILYNSAVDIVPEICGTECIGFKTADEFFEQYKYYTKVNVSLKDEFTAQNCVKQYLDILNAI